MAFSLTSDVEFLRKLPAYTPILKTVLKAQIQLLVNQLSEHGQEESVFLTASMTDGTLSYIGSKSGQGFLENHDDFKSKFLHFCLGRDTASMPVNNRDLTMQASKKMTKTDQTWTKRKHSDSFNSPGAKKLKTSTVFIDSGKSTKICVSSEKATDISSRKTSSISTGMSENCPNTCISLAKTGNASSEDCASTSLENSADICHTLEGDVYSEACSMIKDTEENEPVSLRDMESCCFKKNITADVHGIYTKHLDCVDNNVNESENVDESNSVDECDNGIMDKDNIVIKVEPGWDSDIEGDTMNPEDKTNTEGTSGVSLSNSEKALSSDSGPSTSSGNSAARLQADFLCCNDELIWEKNSLPKQKRIVKSASLLAKYSAIKKVEQGEKTKTVIAEELGIPKSTLSTWLKNSEKIKADIMGEKISPFQKKRRFSNHYDIEEALLEWLKIVHLQAIVPKITSVNICDKANQLAKQLGYSRETFQCTKAWVERFKTRHGFRKNFVRGDSCSVLPSEIFTSEDFVRFSRPRMKATRKCQSLATKYSAIIKVESGEKSRTQVAREHKVGQSTLSTWMKNAKQIKTDYLCNNLPPDRKRARRSQYEDVERGLLQWYRAAKGNNFNLTCVHIAEKADQLARNLGYSPEMFTCTRSWIGRFKLRHGLFKKKSSRHTHGSKLTSDNCLQSVSYSLEQQKGKEMEQLDITLAAFKKERDADS